MLPAQIQIMFQTIRRVNFIVRAFLLHMQYVLKKHNAQKTTNDLNITDIIITIVFFSSRFMFELPNILTVKTPTANVASSR